MSKYIVTGGAGFIGSHLVTNLLSNNHEVVVVDNLSAGKRNYLPNDPNLTLVETDISNWVDFSRKFHYFQDVKGVFHLAAQARIQPSIFDPTITHDSNITGTMNVLEMMRIMRISAIVYSASSSYYGLKNPVPLKEDMLPDCLNPYSMSKYAGELYCKTWGKLYGIKNACLRYFNVYGRRSPTSGPYAPVIGLWFRQVIKDHKDYTIVGDGRQRRDFTHVGDVVLANVAAMEKIVDVTGLTLNVGTGTSHSIKELGLLFEQTLKNHGLEVKSKRLPTRLGEAKETCADCSLIEEKLGWKAQTSLEVGMEDLWGFYNSSAYRHEWGWE